jgi:hypothetical protein
MTTTKAMTFWPRRRASGYDKLSSKSAQAHPPLEIFYRQTLSVYHNARIVVAGVNHGLSSPAARFTAPDLIQVPVPWELHSVRLTEQVKEPLTQVFMWKATNLSVPKLLLYIPAWILL